MARPLPPATMTAQSPSGQSIRYQSPPRTASSADDQLRCPRISGAEQIPSHAPRAHALDEALPTLGGRLGRQPEPLRRFALRQVLHAAEQQQALIVLVEQVDLGEEPLHALVAR